MKDLPNRWRHSLLRSFWEFSFTEVCTNCLTQFRRISIKNTQGNISTSIDKSNMSCFTLGDVFGNSWANLWLFLLVVLQRKSHNEAPLSPCGSCKKHFLAKQDAQTSNTVSLKQSIVLKKSRDKVYIVSSELKRYGDQNISH